MNGSEDVIEKLSQYALDHGYINNLFTIFMDGAKMGINYFSDEVTKELKEAAHATVNTRSDDILENRADEKKIHEAGNEQESSS